MPGQPRDHDGKEVVPPARHTAKLYANGRVCTKCMSGAKQMAQSEKYLLASVRTPVPFPVLGRQIRGSSVLAGQPARLAESASPRFSERPCLIISFPIINLCHKLERICMYICTNKNVWRVYCKFCWHIGCVVYNLQIKQN